MAIIDVADLSKTYGNRTVVDRVSFSVDRGETVAVLGHNAAGKTTTVEMLEGLRSPSSGSIEVLGCDPRRTGRAWRERVAVVLQETAIWGSVTAAEALDLYAGFFAEPWNPDDLLELMGLSTCRDARVGTLSGGQRRRLDLALALVGRPEVLFLDEPTTGFDPAARREAWQFVRSLRTSGTTILLTTHYMDEAEHLADRMLVMAQGSLIADGSSADLARRIGAQSVISFRLAPDLTAADLPRTSGSTETFGTLVEMRVPDATSALSTLTRWATDNGTTLDALTVSRPSLEDVFLQLTRSDHASRDGDDG